MTATSEYWTAVERETVVNTNVIYGSMSSGVIQRPVVCTHAVRVVGGIPTPSLLIAQLAPPPHQGQPCGRGTGDRLRLLAR